MRFSGRATAAARKLRRTGPPRPSHPAGRRAVHPSPIHADGTVFAVYAQHLAAVLAPARRSTSIPGPGSTKPWIFEEERTLQALLEEFMEIVVRAERICEHLSDKTGIILPRTARGLEHALSDVGSASELRPMRLSKTCWSPARSPGNRRKLGEFIGHVGTFRRGFEDLSASAGNVNAILDGQAADKLSGALEYPRPMGTGWSFRRGTEESRERERRDSKAAWRSPRVVSRAAHRHWL